jgi:eukaryotic-like serine/threonine-protein kinase
MVFRNPVKQWWSKVRGGDTHVNAHMTFARTSIGNRLHHTGMMLRRQLWIWPIIAVLFLSLIGYWITSSIQSTMESNLKAQLSALLNVERAMVERWLKRQELSALTLANDQKVRHLIEKLVRLRSSEVDEPPALPGDNRAEIATVNSELAKELGPTLSVYNFVGYIVSDRANQVVASNSSELVGRLIEQYESFLNKVMEDKTTVCPPFSSLTAIKDSQGRMLTGVPTMFVSVPIRDDNFQIIAALSLRIRPEKEFTRMVQLGQIGNSGETYAVDSSGNMVSNSRFDENLILLGLLPDRDAIHSMLNLQLRDPGGNMLQGYRPKVRRSELPLTKNAQSLVEGRDGIDVSGYRDYRGVPRVGAWTWLPDYGFGLTIEIDYQEAFEPLNILKRAFYILFALLTLAAVAIFIFTLVVTRLQNEAREAAIEARQLGQYRLDERLGEGAMGIVYRGHHAMMRRPSAIKLLNLDRVNDASIQRFEREVQITCNLNNPHTIAIYDYGRTPEGVFYYAMEYLDGIDLQQLVDRYGPQPDGRVAKIIDQLCSSLFEAHSMGLVHRDIKPANIMLNRRGGVPDFVKLLDFGLVRAVDDAQRSKPSDGMAGTPLYMSPESIQTPDLVDARSDLYALGAVGYFLLTGSSVFQASTLTELCQQHVDAVPVVPSQRCGRDVDPDLEHAIMSCLEKNRSKRPQTARDLASMLHRLSAGDSWTINDAEAWWSRHDRSVASNELPRGAGGDAAAGPRWSSSSSPSPLAAASPAVARNPSTATGGFDQTIDVPPLEDKTS